MSHAENTDHQNLSPLAQQLLREINGEAPAEMADMALSETAHDAPSPLPGDDLGPPTPHTARSVHTIERPVADRRAQAFAEMLNHLDDADVSSPVDDKAALAAAQRWQAHLQSPDASHLDDMDALDDMDEMTALDDMAAGDDMPGAPMVSDDDDVVFGAVEIVGEADEDDADFDFDADDFDDEDADEKSGGLWSRLRGAGSGVSRLVGFKNAAAAYDAQTGASLLPYTIIRTVVLVLVAAVPPAVNLLVIQPQISDNNRKLTEMRSFEAKAKEDQRVADGLAEKIIRGQKISQRLIQTLPPTSEFESLFNKYLAALQRYGMILNSYNVAPDAERTFVVGDKKLEANIVAIELEGRYDVYAEIRNVFAKESRLLKVVEERIQPVEGSLDLRITSKLLVPTRGVVENE